MLPTEHRIRENSVFQQVFRSGRRLSGTYVVVHLAKSEKSESAKVGFVVSRRVGNAVVRNKTKRRLRAWFRTHLERFHSGDRIVVRALPSAGAASYEQLTQDLETVLRKGQK